MPLLRIPEPVISVSVILPFNVKVFSDEPQAVSTASADRLTNIAKMTFTRSLFLDYGLGGSCRGNTGVRKVMGSWARTAREAGNVGRRWIMASRAEKTGRRLNRGYRHCLPALSLGHAAENAVWETQTSGRPRGASGVAFFHGCHERAWPLRILGSYGRRRNLGIGR